MQYADLFHKATDLAAPYPYQTRLATDSWPDLVEIPTGMGKTAAISLAWLWKRGWRTNGEADPDPETPRRLVWCLPMRVLAEQTASNIQDWLDRLGVLGVAGQGRVSVHLLMGGEDDLKTWAEFPEEDVVLIGTQDMLLSRALMRGYGMSRFQWPVHFALLHNDAFWIFDEVQLMGAGLTTSAQLEAFRRQLPLGRRSRSLWLSATLRQDWLNTVDFSAYRDRLTSLTLDDADNTYAKERLGAVKSLEPASVRLTPDARNKDGLSAYLQSLCNAVLEAHDPSGQTLVIVNRVDRAQGLFHLVSTVRPDQDNVLIHARFRPAERTKQSELLRNEARPDRIIVATQAVEAGVDFSSKVLFTELAPWSSLVQRFGRSNRYGEHNAASGADVYWIDIEDDADPLPYEIGSLASAREKLNTLNNVGPRDLPKFDEARPVTSVLRRKDLLDLFNTDPDLSGFDVDVSDFIRDTGTPGLQVFWRDFDDPNEPDIQRPPSRKELCPISLGQSRSLYKRSAWIWNSLDAKWLKLAGAPRPGMTLLLSADDGGYDSVLGFDPSIRGKVATVPLEGNGSPNGFYGGDWRSQQRLPVRLDAHLAHVAAHAEKLCNEAGETRHAEAVVRAGRWHDLGKAHEVFQDTMHACHDAPEGLLAKSPCSGKHRRRYFRHELASVLAWLAQHDDDPNVDLIAYLIAAHHGKVRMSIRAMPAEKADAGIKRFARGIWEDDVLPSLEFDGERSEEMPLSLAIMELGEGVQGRSWTARTLDLLNVHGPFLLAWLETLVRLSDWRASAAEQRGGN